MSKYLYDIISDKKRGVFPSLMRVILWILSICYFFLLEAILILYRLKVLKKYRLDATIISVGNMTLGGTGKTPFCAMLAQFFEKRGKKVAIVSRGYRSRVAGRSTPLADEAEMLKGHGIDVYVGRNRVRLIRGALKEKAIDIFILDDGFQHWRLYRDLDIVLVDATDPFGKGGLLPCGTLREPLSHLGRAHVIVLTRIGSVSAEERSHIKSRFSYLAGGAVIFEADHIPIGFHLWGDEVHREDLSFVKGKCVCALSSIGNPRAFIRMIEGLGARVAREESFLDHHAFQRTELDEIFRACASEGIEAVVTTEKDEVRLREVIKTPLTDVRLVVLEIAVRIVSGDEDGFFKRIAPIAAR